MISLKAYTNWINKAPNWINKAKTARISYYRGYLCDPKLGSISPSDNTRVFRLRKLVQDSQEDKLVTLVQKRHGDFDYEYIAVRT